MKRTEITGYVVQVLIEKKGNLYYASAPGIGSIYIEESSRSEALRLAKEAVISIMEARREVGREITEDNEYLKVIRSSKASDDLFYESSVYIRKGSRSRIKRRTAARKST